MEIIENTVMMTFDELRILLYSQGFKKCNGVFMPWRDFSPKDILSALDKLEKDGLLYTGDAEYQTESLPLVFDDEDEKKTKQKKEEEFYIRSDILKMLSVIGKPAACSTFSSSDGRHVFCYFSEQGIVTSEKAEGRRETLRLRFIDPADYDEWKKNMEEEDDSSGS